MRDWNLAAGDPLHLTLTADFRFSKPDYVNDHVWELELGGGDPAALSLHTTYGLRARSMRIFPRFISREQIVSDPTEMVQPPCIKRFYPNFIMLNLSPFNGINTVIEYWVPTSQTISGRLSFSNNTTERFGMTLELCGQLLPQEGQSLTAESMRSLNILVGQTSNLAPVIFLTGGPLAGPGPYPSLTLDLELAPGASRTLVWAQAALNNHSASLDLARQIAARPWEAERVKIEMLNASQSLDISTGDQEWDAAFAFSQKTAFSLFFPANEHLPFPSFVLARQPDSGHSLRGDGSDYSYLWNGQTPLEAYYLTSLIPGAPEYAASILRNFLSVQLEDGSIDWKPGLAGQRSRLLATPLLVNLAWQIFQINEDTSFLDDVFPNLLAFFQQWFTNAHDQDGDGFPEWEHPTQTGFEDNPTFAIEHAGGQGAEISIIESPALPAMLFREAILLAKIAVALGQDTQYGLLESRADNLRSIVENCWDSGAGIYRYQDRDTHKCESGELIGDQISKGNMDVHRSLRRPVHIIVEIQIKGEAPHRLEIIIHGRHGKQPQMEKLERTNFHWGVSTAFATTRLLFTRLDRIEVVGIDAQDRIIVKLMDLTLEDHTLFLPLWAGIPSVRRAKNIVSKTLFDAERFGRPFGIPACTQSTGTSRFPIERIAESIHMAVHFPWNQLIGEGLLAYNLREEAAQLTTKLMSAVIYNLKKQHAFYQTYHAESGAGMGIRNALHGLAPLGLFLQTLGIQIVSQTRVRLSGKNPFPWPVTVKYRRLVVSRQLNQSMVTFPNGETITLVDPTDAIVSAD